MPYDSEGNFTRIHNWEDDRVNDIEIVTDHHDAEDDNFAEALSSCFLRDGRAPMRGDVNCAGFKVKNLAAGTLASDAVNRGQLDKSIADSTADLAQGLNSLSFIGDIKASLQTQNHGNWLLCNGQAVSRGDYAALFALLGTKFGGGDGVTTFNIPDYQGKFLRGLGGDSAADMQTTQAEGLPDHEHSYTAQSRHGRSGAGPTGAWWSDGDVTYGNPTGTVTKASASNPIYGASNHVTPINQAVNFFIKAREE